MRKSDLVEKAAERMNFKKADVVVMLDAFLDVIMESMTAGHEIEIRGFGRFKILNKVARSAYNFQKKERMMVPAHKTPKFIPSNIFVAMMNEKGQLSHDKR